MHVYPQLPGLRARQACRDALVLLTLATFGALGWAVRAAVMELTAISEGLTSSATDAQQQWAAVGDTLSRIPLVGQDIQQAVDGLASATLGQAAEAGQGVTDAVAMAATVLGTVTFAVPTLLLLVLWLPRRLDRARAWDAAHRVLAASAPSRPGLTSPRSSGPDVVSRARAAQAPTGPATPDLAGEHAYPPEELLALRALCHLPFVDLAPFCPRPFEAFRAGDYAPLVAALYAHEGLVAPPSRSGG
jgi:hypothetical protein